MSRWMVTRVRAIAGYSFIGAGLFLAHSGKLGFKLGLPSLHLFANQFIGYFAHAASGST
jgi:hypothetical protein